MLSNETRQALASAVRRVRRLVEADLETQLRGVYGLHAEGGAIDAIEPVDALGDIDPNQLHLRQVLIEAISYISSREGVEAHDAIREVHRLAVASITNRIVALRVGEGLGSLPAVTANGTSSRFYREVLDLCPLLSSQDNAYRVLLAITGDELAVGAPQVFNRLNPLFHLEPSLETYTSAIAALNHPDVVSAWAHPESLGWAYQYFNLDEERRGMREAASAPRDTRELAVRNQFFTPRYVVDWLVDQTLGVSLSRLKEMELSDRIQALEAIRILDPAVGSGHFLLGCYDALERAYSEVGLTGSESAWRILRSLVGIEIDPRAAQIAQLTLVLRAGRGADLGGLAPPLIVSAQALPDDEATVAAIGEKLPPSVRDLFTHLVAATREAPTLGSLLKLETDVKQRLKGRFAAPQLGDQPLSIEEAEELLSAALSEMVDRDLHAYEWLSAIDASDAAQLLSVLAARYDVVLMNPPFGAAVPETESYLGAHYDSPHRDLYTYFIERGLELLTPEGRLGAITNQTFAIRRSYEKYRRWLLSEASLRAYLDLGWEVLDAQVEVAAYVLDRGEPDTITFINGRSEAQGHDLARPIDSLLGYEFEQHILERMPGATFLYALHPSAARWLASSGDVAAVAHPGEGIHAPGSDRYFRLWWESLGSTRPWVPIANGGPHAPFLRDWKLVADWSDDAQVAYNTTNRDWYFQKGLSWGKRSTYLNVQPLPPGMALTAEGHGLHLGVEPDSVDEDEDRLYALLGLLNSRPYVYLIEHTAGLQKNSGYIGGLPLEPDHLETGLLSDHSRRIVDRLNRIRVVDETSRHFVGPSVLAWGVGGGSMKFSEAADERQWLQRSVLEEYRSLDGVVLDLLDLEDLECTLDGELGPIVDPDDETERAASTLTERYFVIGEEFGDLERRAGARGPEPTREAREFVSFLVGCAFGRFDWSSPRIPSPFDELPDRSPVMPAEFGAAPLLHDLAGAPSDIVMAMEEFASEAGLAEMLNEAERLLGGSLRAYLRRSYPDYLTERYRYGKRVAPPYWNLAVPSREWGLWLHAERLDREILFAVAREAQAALERVRTRSESLEAIDRPDRDVREERDALHDLAEELRDFSEEASAVAQSGWVPNLDEGYVLVATPLAGLLASNSWKKHVEKQRQAVERGKVDWTSVDIGYV